MSFVARHCHFLAKRKYFKGVQTMLIWITALVLKAKPIFEHVLSILHWKPTSFVANNCHSFPIQAFKGVQTMLILQGPMLNLKPIMDNPFVSLQMTVCHSPLSWKISHSSNIRKSCQCCIGVIYTVVGHQQLHENTKIFDTLHWANTITSKQDHLRWM